MSRHQGEVSRLVELGWPIVLGNLGGMMLGVVDTLMLGALGPAALAGGALAHSWSFGLLVLGRGAAFGMDPVITQAHGARDQGAVGRGLAHGFVLLTILAVPITLLHLLVRPAMGLLGQPPEVLDLTTAYTWVASLAVLPAVWSGLLRQALQARGHTRPVLWVALLGNAVNVPANLLFIHGAGGWSGFGAVGVAWSTVIVRIAMCAALAAFALPEVRAIAAGLGAVGLAGLRRVAAVALPVAGQVGLEVWGFTFATFLVGWFGADAVAAQATVLQISSVAFMVPLGLGAAAATRVGNLVGAGAPWRDAAWTAIGLGAGIMLISASVFALWPGPLVSAWLDPGTAFGIALTLMPVVAAFQVFDGTQAVAFGVLRGAGDTLVPSVANVIAFYVLGLPLGMALAVGADWGPLGVWVGLAVALGCVSAMLLVRVAMVQRLGGIRRIV